MFMKLERLLDGSIGKTRDLISLDRINSLMEAAFYAVVVEEGGNIPKGKNTEPGPGANQFENQLYFRFKRQVRDGMALERSISGS